MEAKSESLDFRAYDEMLAGKPDAGNPHVRFDEGEQRDWRKPPVALYSSVSLSLKARARREGWDA